MTGKKTISILLLTVVTFLSGCSEAIDTSSEAETSETSVVTITPQPEQTTQHISTDKTLYLSMNPPKTLNPILNEDVTVDEILKLLFMPIIVFDENKKPMPNPELINNINFSDDGLHLEIDINQGILWSDGTEITAKDLVFTLNTLKSARETSIYYFDNTNILSFAKTGDYQVTLIFEKPNFGFYYSLDFPIIPEHHYLGETDLESVKNMNPVSNGYYRIVGYKPFSGMKLQAVQNNNNLKIKDIEVVFSPDNETELQLFDRRIIDIKKYGITEVGKYFSKTDVTAVPFIDNMYEFIGLNFDNRIITDKAVRQAIAHCVPYDMLENNQYDMNIKTNSPISPDSWLYNNNLEESITNLEEAKNVLQLKGWADMDNNRVLDKEFVISETDTSETDIEETKIEVFSLKLKVLVNQENEERKEIAKIFVENLNKCGFDAMLIIIPFDEYEIAISSGEYDIYFGGYCFSKSPEISFLFQKDDSELGYADVRIGMMIRRINHSTNFDEYKAAYDDLQKYIFDEIKLISLSYKKSLVVINNRLEASKLFNLYNSYPEINEWVIIQ